MKTDLEKFQEIVADINTIIFGTQKTLKDMISKHEIELYGMPYEETNLDNRTIKPKKKRGRGRPKGSKNKKSKWL